MEAVGLPDASSLVPPALDQLRNHPEVVSEEVPSLLRRLAEVPDARGPRGVCHRLAVGKSSVSHPAGPDPSTAILTTADGVRIVTLRGDPDKDAREPLH